MGQGRIFCFSIFRIFCLVFVISSIPERDKQHFQGEKKKSCYQKAKKGESSTFPCFRLLAVLAHLGSLLFPAAPLVLVVFSHSAFPLCPSCPVSNWPHMPSLCGKWAFF